MEKIKSRKVTPTYNLAVMYPHIAKEWHPKLNENLTPDKITPGSAKKVWWVCENGHVWQTKVLHRTQVNAGCKHCRISKITKDNNIAILYPHLLKEWCYELNDGLDPYLLKPNSTKKVWWVCSRCNHRWKTNVQHRASRGQGCKECAKLELKQKYTGQKMQKRRLLKDEFLELMKEWHPIKNSHLDMNKITSGSSNIPVWWVCKTCNNEWTSNVANRTLLNRGCPQCNLHRTTIEHNLSVLYPELVNEWDWEKNGDLIPDKIAPKSNKSVWWVCQICSHSWKALVRHRTVMHTGCPNHFSHSKIEN
ncbi:zinc-ribbon domain-containing protein [Brevibacillus sp. NPDC003359]|uniref:zinc-ribbon domain-containing protein n=1 Tax=unclassified Brevibacillus TaxID=2684853 RepID=UPI0036A0B7AB